MGKLLLWIGLFLAACLSAQTISLENFVSGISNPVEIVASPTSDNRLFVVQQSGTIKIVNENGTIAPDNFLNISNLITFGGERGLLGLAFHPQFLTNRYFFVYYNNLQGSIRVSRFTANSSNPNTADVSSEKILLTIPKPFTNHNGGSIHFGADGYLWISTGDGGSGGDPNNNAQNKNSLLGKMLRIDVNSDNAYNIPSDNPFVGIDGADEIWAYGLRNAWKFSFDRTTNQVWIADVGQGDIEEINKVSAATPGINYGWRCYEGNTPYNTTGCANASTMTFPVAQYDHSGGKCSITGGYLYRGNLYTDLVGKYVFADYCSAQIGVLDTSNTMVWSPSFSANFTTFGEDNQKQLYVAAGNTIYKIKTNNLAVSDINQANILITPNPAKEKIYLQNVNEKNISAEILDLTGRIVHQVQMSDTDNSIDVSKLQQGTYLLNLKKDNQKWISKKFIKE
ncbi:PQQ-dependent sugar dehydrogenase [Epilithonimonas pallida]|uniref:Por secretion system C-terminal sorting domain-containing protein n=1 Tax=Epilithonimonas pallida TaxID=373671 RepID=A0ABY1R6D3_9FLAO|nr:PQQ-dependent sugar dehydrogenase [Epilithonimonas pallida]SMP94942.1 Por secretion system C-terminal sorting domain-containing protein [Epilithonimonas pallida]